MRSVTRSALAVLTSLLVALSVLLVQPGPAISAGSAASTPAPSARASANDAFYHYTGRTPLRRIKLGTVLKSRTVSYHVAGLPLPIQAVQLLYRARDMRKRPVVNVTTVLQQPGTTSSSTVLSYQSFYDSLNPDDEPSVAIAGGLGTGDGIAYVETGIFAPLLLAGATIVITDTEGQTADFAAGPEYGTNTLDGLRAVLGSPRFHLTPGVRIGMLGYSGGAIATEWAAELAPSYAPGVAKHLVGSAYGGVLVEPAHNLHYVEGTPIWSGVLPQALVGVGRAFGVDLSRYATAEGKKILASMKRASIADVLGHYPGLTWSDIVQKRYPQPENLRVFVRLSNQLIMGRSTTAPTSPMFIGQGTGGPTEGTPGDKPGIGAGDGVMIAGDVRTLARSYCRRGVHVQYQQLDGLSHVGAAAAFLPLAYQWLLGRFAVTPRSSNASAPSSCGSIPRGNHVGPVRYRPAR